MLIGRRSPSSALSLRFLLALLFLLACVGVGCAGSGNGGRRAVGTGPMRVPPGVARKTSDGLELARSTKRSVLWVKPDHHLGRYDDVIVQVAPTFLYAEGETPLDPEQEKEVGDVVRSALAGITTNGPVGVATAPGPCTVVVNVGLKDVRLHSADPSVAGASTSFVSSFGSVTLVVEFRDSLSNTPLLRYMAARGLGGGPGTGQPGANLPRLGRTLGELLTGMIDELARIVPSTTAKQTHQCNDGIYALTGRG
jgi:hypothetical protein